MQAPKVGQYPAQQPYGVNPPPYPGSEPAHAIPLTADEENTVNNDDEVNFNGNSFSDKKIRQGFIRKVWNFF